MKTFFLKFLLLAGFCLFGQTMTAQYLTEFHITDLDNEELKPVVDKNISALLTTFNNAQGIGWSASFRGIAHK